ncbi:hypothetical protein HDV00_001763 [Rhizophlyctis rosea]|nr:hypothetical protein HDV00_001763 [Rhizophlyctis rosea]
MYNYTDALPTASYRHQNFIRSVACSISISIRENTKEWGDTYITASAYDDLPLEYIKSVNARKMSSVQSDALANHYLLQLYATVTLRDNAEVIFGDLIELANSRLIDGNTVVSPDLTLENHFRYMARQHQRLLRAQVIGHVQGSAYEGVILTPIQSIHDAGMTDDGYLRVVCPGFALSIFRLLIILLPLLLTTLVCTIASPYPSSPAFFKLVRALYGPALPNGV